MKNKTGKKTLRLGTYSLVLCLVALAVVVALNLIVGALPSTMTKFDVSGSNLYELSAETKTICENLDSEITMYLLATRGKEDQRILTLLEKYEALSARLKLETVEAGERAADVKVKFSAALPETYTVRCFMLNDKTAPLCKALQRTFGG